MSQAVRQKSEDVIINAPMSFAGAAQRAWRLRRVAVGADGPWLAKLPMTVVAIVLLILWWAAIATWYILFGLALLPYRILRRGARKRKKEALRHREVMAALEQKPPAQPQLEQDVRPGT